MNAIEKFYKVVDSHHQYAKEWKKRKDNRVIGYFCTYTPEEIPYAAGMLPVRIIGSHEVQSMTGPHMYNWFCPFSRDCLSQGLKGMYDYLDGIMMGHGCMHMKHCFDSWEKHVTISYSRDIYIPRNVKSRYAKSCFVQELIEFKLSLEKWMGMTISESMMNNAINVYNRNRQLMRKVYELRKKDPPFISGVEATGMVLASMLMDKEEHNRLLEQALEELSKRDTGHKRSIRLMLAGSPNDNIEFVRFVEAVGATIVIDDLCTGSRYFWNEIKHQHDALESIADYYVTKPLCPEKDLMERQRPNHILSLANDYKVHGVILIQQKFCDRFQWDIPKIQSLLKQINIPSIVLELDTTLPIGQYSTRIESLLEQIATDSLW